MAKAGDGDFLRSVGEAVVQLLMETVSTRRVTDLVRAMGLAVISKSRMSKLCKDLDDRLNSLLGLALVGD